VAALTYNKWNGPAALQRVWGCCANGVHTGGSRNFSRRRRVTGSRGRRRLSKC